MGPLRVRVLPSGQSATLAAGERLLDALDDAAAIMAMPTACRGGTCGACLVQVVRGAEALCEAQPHERETLDALGAAADQRLGCQLRTVASPGAGAAGAGELVLRVIRS